MATHNSMNKLFLGLLAKAAQVYGFVELALKEFVRSQSDGERKWNFVQEKCKHCHSKINFHTPYSDAETLAYIKAAAEILDISFEECLSQIGYFQVQVLVEKGYLPLVKSLGSNFYEFLLHLDAMHLNLVNAYPSMAGPSFKPERNKDGSLLLHYYSSRTGIYPYAIALLKDVATKVFSVNIELNHVIKKGIQSDHDVFHIFMGPEGYGEKEYFDSVTTHTSTGRLSFDTPMVDTIFPWHFAFKRDMTIVSMGPKLTQRIPFNYHGKSIYDIFSVVRPDIHKHSFDDIASKFDRRLLVMRLKPQSQQKCPFASAFTMENGKKKSENVALGCAVPKSTTSLNNQSNNSHNISDEPLGGITILKDSLFLKGELVYLEKEDKIVYLCIPTVSSLDEMNRQQLAMEDLPIHSNGRELVICTAHQSATVDMAQTLQKMTTSLDDAMANLDIEKKRTIGLLYSILPTQVADALSEGRVPDPEHFEAVSILFSDIVGFTKISASVPVHEIMAMLNELFSKFDALCSKFGVYKVETIGDAYMVASGLPKADPRHADTLAAFAIEMVAAAETVTSPMDGDPLAIRVGMHSGRIMAGVVGKERPRYCLFGDTVNVASRMESTGVGGAAQVSYAFIKALTSKSDWNILTRGTVKVKGKGEMKTFFLLGKAGSNMQLAPPDAGNYESEAQTPLAGSFPSTSGYSSPPSQQSTRTSAPFQTQNIQANPLQFVTTQEPEVMYEVEIFSQSNDIRMPFVPSKMTLAELMIEIHHDRAETDDLRFYLDQCCTEMLIPSMTLQQLHNGLVSMNTIGMSCRCLRLYANLRISLDGICATPLVQTRAPSIPDISCNISPASNYV